MAGARIMSWGSKMWAFLKAPNVWRTLALVGVFWIAAWAFDFIQLYTFTRTALLATEVGALSIYAVASWNSATAPKPSDGDLVALGIWIAILGNLALGVWALVQRVWEIQWMLTSDWITFWIAIQLIGYTYQILGPGVRDGIIPRGNYVPTAVAFALGVATTVVLMVYGPLLIKKM